jgi:uncharacterized protein
MNLLETIEKDLREAIKGGNTLKSETLKMLKSDFMYEKAKTGKDLPEDKMLEVVARAAKRRKESITEFRKGNREDLAQKESDELAIIESYLPAQMSEQEIEAHIDAKLKSLGEISKKDFGKVMGEIMKDLKGKAEGGAVRAILNRMMEKL